MDYDSMSMDDSMSKDYSMDDSMSMDEYSMSMDDKMSMGDEDAGCDCTDPERKCAANCCCACNPQGWNGEQYSSCDNGCVVNHKTEPATCEDPENSTSMDDKMNCPEGTYEMFGFCYCYSNGRETMDARDCND